MEIDPKIKIALFISSKTGAIRANHFHKHDTHYTYLLSGKFEYVEKATDKKNAKIQKKIIVPGDLVVTLPNDVHAMRFLEDSTMLVFSTEPRDQTNYENDTVRVKLV